MQILQHVPTHFDAERCNASLFDTLSESCNVSKSTKVVWLGSGQNDLGRNDVRGVAEGRFRGRDFETGASKTGLRDQDFEIKTRIAARASLNPIRRICYGPPNPPSVVDFAPGFAGC